MRGCTLLLSSLRLRERQGAQRRCRCLLLQAGHWADSPKFTPMKCCLFDQGGELLQTSYPKESPLLVNCSSFTGESCPLLCSWT